MFLVADIKVEKIRIMDLKSDLKNANLDISTLKQNNTLLTIGIDKQNEYARLLDKQTKLLVSQFNNNRVEYESLLNRNTQYYKKLTKDMKVPSDCGEVNEWLIKKAKEI